MKRDYIDFQDRTWPKAFLITFSTYGTWLHGDERQSVNRRGKNRVGTPRLRPSRGLENYEKGSLKFPSFRLTSSQRKAVEDAIRNVCKVRGYALYAINVRTNHVHIVVSTGKMPENAMNAFKSYGTRILRERGLVDRNQRIWTRHGSTRYLWTEESVEKAIAYVVLGQGADLD